MKTILITLYILLFCSFYSIAQENVDTLPTTDLNEFVVEGQLQHTSAMVSTYIPTSRQKNASQNGPDLLNRMGIPQITVDFDNVVKTNSGQDVSVFIDYLPASSQDLQGMRMADVRKVEYYDYPNDSRFMGSAHVVNFIMQKYEYGGYVKTSAKETFISNSGSLNLYSKLQYKKMTYDLAVGGFYNSSGHNFSNMEETYRLPQVDGSIKEFKRFSLTNSAESRQHNIWPTFKAVYNSDKIMMSNIIGASFDNYPKENSSGSVKYMPADFSDSDFSNIANHRSNYITYNGFWNFRLPHGNEINFVPYYSYSSSRQSIHYKEGNTHCLNEAKDNSHEVKGNLSYKHDFGKWGDVSLSLQTLYTDNKTRYFGLSTVDDHLTTLRMGPGVNYSIYTGKFYGSFGVGFTYNRSKEGEAKESTTEPWMDAFVQYAFNSKNSVNVSFNWMNSFPFMYYRSSVVIRSNPLMSYTGNPDLKVSTMYFVSANYLWLPSNKFSLSFFGWVADCPDRYAYVYEASPTGILRTVQQPIGHFLQSQYGVNGSVRLFDGNLQISGKLAHLIARNTEPFNWTKSNLNYNLQAFYYLDKWQFGLKYQSGDASADGSVRGTWMSKKSTYAAIIGWGNSSWNIQAQVNNPFRSNWQYGETTLRTQYYDFNEWKYNTSRHCSVQVSATYTFGFGKKIQRGDEAMQQQGAGSAILQ